MPNLGIDRLDPALLAATDRLSGAVAAAVETGAAQVAPSHLLIALGRVPGSVAAGLFGRSRIPVEAFVEALRAQSPPRHGLPPTELTYRTAATGTREALGALPPAAGERDLLAAVLPRLEPAADLLLREYARADLDQWVRECRAEPVPAREVFGGDGRLLLDRFSPGARRVLAALAAREDGFGPAPLTTALLLRAMAAVPNGLIEQGCHFLGQDVRVLRLRMTSLTDGGSGSSGSSDPSGPSGPGGALSRGGLQELLARTLESAAAVAARRGGDPVAERDLLAALLDTPAGLAAGVLRDTRVDVTRLRRYAEEYYRELPAQEPDTPVHLPPLHESLDRLRERLIGREAVIDRLTPSLERITRSLRRGLRLADQPLGRFLFCGPSGTGKTLAAHALAQVVYGSEQDVLFFEMGQFNTKESMNNFIGAAPGYVGYGEGKLTNGLRDNPRRVLLFDEVEKADGRVLDALLRLLDEGRISDPAGPVRDARDSVIVLTSNLGAAEFAGLAQPEAAVQVRRIMEGFFRPEFLNRIDEVVLFETFRPEELEAIALGGLRRQAARITAQLGVELCWKQELPARIADLARTRRPAEAARGVNRYVDGVLAPLLRLLDEADARGAAVERARIVLDGERLSVVNDGD
ncbi:AAA family ATPase [Streptomyces sp. NPDC057623]|uniref:AAA family ATPase n=1 Tax=Streptomyces sp. NPDC057623 TaxID=3346187 RepID=UPI003685C65A